MRGTEGSRKEEDSAIARAKWGRRGQRITLRASYKPTHLAQIGSNLQSESNSTSSNARRRRPGAIVETSNDDSTAGLARPNEARLEYGEDGEAMCEYGGLA